MTNIDPETGLPELPPNHIWQVGKYGVSILEQLADTDWEERNLNNPYSVWDYAQKGRRETRTTTKSRKVTKTRLVPSKSFWSFRAVAEEYTETESYEVTEVRFVNRAESVVTVKSEVIGTKVIRGEYVPGYSYYHYIPGYYRSDRNYDVHKVVTRDDLPELMEEALKQLAAKDLYGTYPPKKFEA